LRDRGGGQQSPGLFVRWRTALADKRNMPGWANQTFCNRRQRVAPTCLEKAARRVHKLRYLVGQTLVFLGAGDERLGNGRDLGMFEWHNHAFKRNLQHFIHGFYKMNFETGEDLLRDIR
jgi:hypothetical protein